MDAGVISAASQIAATPVITPRELSAGVEGVLCRQKRPLPSSNSSRSVNVPPTSTPSR